jgi:hypothetical protein
MGVKGTESRVESRGHERVTRRRNRDNYNNRRNAALMEDGR